MKPMLRGIAVAVAAVGVVACVKQAWRVTYPGPGDYSSAHALAVAPDGTAYMSGFTRQGQLFVVAYRSNGSLLWEQLIDADAAGNNLFPGKALALDAAGDLYFTSFGLPDMTTVLYKLDGRTGEQLFDRELAEGSAYTQLEVGTDGLLYLAGWSNVAAYTMEGDLQWSLSSASSLPAELEGTEGNNLGTYPGNAVTTSQNVISSTGATALYRAQRFAFVNGRTYVMLDDRILELDAAGQTLNETTANDLGMNSIDGLLESEDGLLVIGQENNAVVSIRLDLAFAQLSRHELATGNWRDLRISGGEDHVCIGLYEPVSRAVEIQQLGYAGDQLWAKPVSQEGSVEWEFAHVLAAGSDCYVGLPVQPSTTELQTITRLYDGSGRLSDTITLQQFQTAGLGVQGNAIYHAGMTEAGDPARAIAALSKHQRY